MESQSKIGYSEGLGEKIRKLSFAKLSLRDLQLGVFGGAESIPIIRID
jgi:hypothetical protein